jgi:hypothetical protein
MPQMFRNICCAIAGVGGLEQLGSCRRFEFGHLYHSTSALVRAPLSVHARLNRGLKNTMEAPRSCQFIMGENAQMALGRDLPRKRIANLDFA